MWQRHSDDVLMCQRQLLEDDDGLLMSGFSIDSNIGMNFGQGSVNFITIWDVGLDISFLCFDVVVHILG